MHTLTMSGRGLHRVWYSLGLRTVLVIVTPVILSLDHSPAVAQCDEQQKLVPTLAPSHEHFGYSVAVSGDTAIVGMVDWRNGETPPGSAYVFQFDGTSWIQTQQLRASDSAARDYFGSAVSISGDLAVVGARGHAAGTSQGGSAYVFRFNGMTWVEEQKLAVSDSAAQDGFGNSVSVGGDVAVIGAFRHSGAAYASGSAYVFRFDGTTWVEEQELSASDAADSDFFGRSVSVSGDTAIVGADLHENIFQDSGSAYVFRFDGVKWVEEQMLVASNEADGEFFGYSVSVNGDTAVVGAFGDRRTVSGGGAAYVFQFDGIDWTLTQELTATDASIGALFGFSVSVEDNTAIIGAPSSPWRGTGGSAYVFRFDGANWVERSRLTASDRNGGENFGWSVSVGGARVVVGAMRDSDSEFESGSAYAFSCPEAPVAVNLDIKPGSCPNPVNPKSRGVVPMAIVGEADFDVSRIDPYSLMLSRADGVGSGVLPDATKRDPRAVIADVATPGDDEHCGCHELDGDGVQDLSIKIRTQELARAFELHDLLDTGTIEVVLRGTLDDGTAFEASDCITVVGKRRIAGEPVRLGIGR